MSFMLSSKCLPSVDVITVKTLTITLKLYYDIPVQQHNSLHRFWEATTIKQFYKHAYAYICCSVTMLLFLFVFVTLPKAMPNRSLSSIYHY